MLVLLAALAAALIIWIAWGNGAVEATGQAVESSRLPAGFDGFRIAHISDLHNASFGAENERLLDLLEEEEPDIIAITGDLIDARRTDMDVALDFAEEALDIAPVYYAPGNHESRIFDYPEFEENLRVLGVTVLRKDTLTLERGGDTIRLAGLEDPSFTPLDTREDAGGTALWTEGQLRELLGAEDVFTLLLSHRPDLLPAYAGAGVDLALCGHAHGGQIRLPGLGGVVAPNQGFFPKVTEGLHRSGNAQMVVSRGLGNSLFPFRVNNRPEIVMIELKKS